MRKVISGRVYDTDVAQKIVEYWNGLPVWNFRHCVEILYKTAKGNYFLYAEGGSLTKYAKGSVDPWSCYLLLIELPRNEAFEWLSEKGFSKIMQMEFADLMG